MNQYGSACASADQWCLTQCTIMPNANSHKQQIILRSGMRRTKNKPPARDPARPPTGSICMKHSEIAINAFASIDHCLQFLHGQSADCLGSGLGLEHTRLLRRRVDTIANRTGWLQLQLPRQASPTLKALLFDRKQQKIISENMSLLCLCLGYSVSVHFNSKVVV